MGGKWLANQVLNWRPKSRKSQTSIAAPGQSRSMRSVPGNRIHAFGNGSANVMSEMARDRIHACRAGGHSVRF